MHSMLNNLNILQSELRGHRLTLAQDADLLKDGLTVCRENDRGIGRREKTLRNAVALPQHCVRMMAEIERALTSMPIGGKTPR